MPDQAGKMVKAMICGSWGGAEFSVARIVAPRRKAWRSRATWPAARAVIVCPSSWMVRIVVGLSSRYRPRHKDLTGLEFSGRTIRAFAKLCGQGNRISPAGYG